MGREVMLIDTHTHLDFPDFDPDRPEVWSRARDAGVSRCLMIGTDAGGSERVVDLAGRLPGARPVVGLHPCYVDEAAPDWRTRIAGLAARSEVAAVGETGLDYHHSPSRRAGIEPGPEAEARDAAHRARQREVFLWQLELAVELGRNVVIHQREAWEDTLAVLRPYAGRLRAVFHCFGGTPEQVAEVTAMGHYVSFTGIVTFRNADQVRASVRAVAADRYFLETDCPYLAPVPHRGRRCEPAFVREIAAAVAAVRGVSPAQVAGETTRNAEFFFAMDRESA